MYVLLVVTFLYYGLRCIVTIETVLLSLFVSFGKIVLRAASGTFFGHHRAIV
jgi:hypothetical protein